MQHITYVSLCRTARGVKISSGTELYILANTPHRVYKPQKNSVETGCLPQYEVFLCTYKRGPDNQDQKPNHIE